MCWQRSAEDSERLGATTYHHLASKITRNTLDPHCEVSLVHAPVLVLNLPQRTCRLVLVGKGSFPAVHRVTPNIELLDVRRLDTTLLNTLAAREFS